MQELLTERLPVRFERGDDGTWQVAGVPTALLEAYRAAPCLRWPDAKHLDAVTRR
jgi:hypothetical protein